MPTIDPMQQEAMRRVQAMQSRVNQSRPQRTQNVHNPQRTQNPPKPQEISEEHTEETKISQDIEFKNKVPFETSDRNNIERKNKSPIDVLLKDKEQNLILLLIVLLAGDEANQNLLLALIYLLI